MIHLTSKDIADAIVQQLGRLNKLRPGQEAQVSLIWTAEGSVRDEVSESKGPSDATR